MTRIIDNEALIKRNRNIGRYASGGGLVVLVGGLIFSFVRPELFWVPLVTLFAGFMLSNLGIFYANRYIRQPVAHEVISNALKGLDNKTHDLYNYYFPASHALFSPSGIWLFVPRFQTGEVTWDAKRNRLKHKGGNAFRAFFGQEGLGNPVSEAKGEADSMQRYLEQYFQVDDIPKIRPVVVFTSPEVELGDMSEATMPVVAAKKLRDLIKNAEPEDVAFDLDQIDQIEESIGLE